MLDDSSCYILKLAVAKTGVQHIKIKHRPRLLSDNGSVFISEALSDLSRQAPHPACAWCTHHPQTQGIIERYHRSMKSIVKLDNYYAPSDLEQTVVNFVVYYNTQRYMRR